MKVRPLADFLKLLFVCHISYVIVDALQYSSWFPLQIDLISKVGCVLYLLYIMNVRTVILSNITFICFSKPVTATHHQTKFLPNAVGFVPTVTRTGSSPS